MKTTLLLLFFFLNSFFIAAQPPAIEWQKCYGGLQHNALKYIAQTTDGGYIMGGKTDCQLSGNQTQTAVNNDFWIVKINATGDIEWQRVLGTDEFDEFSGIKQTTDGGYIIVGYGGAGISGVKTFQSHGITLDYWILKLDSQGTILWQKGIGGDNSDETSNIETTNDGGFIICGLSTSNISFEKTENSRGSSDYWIVKCDANGNVQWDKTIGGFLKDIPYVVRQTQDGGYIVGGLSNSNISGDKTENNVGNHPQNDLNPDGDDYWIVKLSANGQIEWQNTIGSEYADELSDIIETFDGNFIVLGASSSNISGDKTENSIGYGDAWIVKLDPLGSIIWDKTIGGLDSDGLSSIIETNDHKLVLSGSSKSGIGGFKTEPMRGLYSNYDIWLVKIGMDGNFIWDKTIGGNKDDGATIIKQTSDNGFIVGAGSSSNISYDKTVANFGFANYWILKLSPENLSNNEISIKESLQIYPNPTTGTINFSKNIVLDSVEIVDNLGRSVKQFSKVENNTLELKELSNGIYFCIIHSNGEKIIQKIIVEK